MPGTFAAVRVALDAWPQRKQWQEWRRWHQWDHARRAPAPRRAPRGAAARLRSVDWPLRGQAVLWVGIPWVIHRPAPAPIQPTPEGGTPAGDLAILLSAGANDAAKLAALERTVDRIPWAPRRPAVRRALAARADDLGGGTPSLAVLKRQELRAAVYLVLAERERPQAHRFGRSWLTGPDGRTATVTPERLPPPLYWRWFCDEVRKAAEAALVGDPYPLPSHPCRGGVALSESSLQLAACPDHAPDPLDHLLTKERRREASQWWRAALAEATPRQRQLLRTLLALDDAPPGAQPPTLADAAQRIGMAPSTARVQWQRLVQRMRTRHPAWPSPPASSPPA